MILMVAVINSDKYIRQKTQKISIARMPGISSNAYEFFFFLGLIIMNNEHTFFTFFNDLFED